MTIVADANVVIAVIDSNHLFHRPALRRCLEAGDVAVLNLTRAEALIHPTRTGHVEAVDAELERLRFRTEVLDNEVADGARVLRATYGNRNFPMIDAVVVALGMVRGWPIVTCEAKWPALTEATIETLIPAN